MSARHEEAIAHLKEACPRMRAWIRLHGPCGLEVHPARTPFQSLVNAVAHQQLHARAAESILGRFRGLFPGGRFPGPKSLALASDEELRSVGFSRAKTAAIRDIAAKTIAGLVPGPREIRTLSDEEIIDRLVQVRGVGRWTVEMLLIFTLDRPDVWPVDDYGVRAGWRNLYGLETMPAPKELRMLGGKFSPHRTVAAWYLWRAADAGPQGMP